MSETKPSACESLVGLACTILAIPFNGWIGAILWAWFVVPLGMPSLSISQAIALGLTGKFFFAYLPRDTWDTREEMWSRIGRMYAYPVVAIISGWIIGKLGGLI